ncbi:MAG TPA: pyridoxamine 5'-phosphate oxidase family protein [Acidobacteriota bacterium]|nr:pyridoxamine 5'-phosphate oxidase family protein [Acidobacteriota bacterium]
MSEPVTRIRQHPERAVPEEAAGILAAAHVAHVGFVVEGQPYVIPFTYHFDPAMPDRLYLHGSLTGRALNALGAGAPACVAVSLVDGLVASKTAEVTAINGLHPGARARGAGGEQSEGRREDRDGGEACGRAAHGGLRAWGQGRYARTKAA